MKPYEKKGWYALELPDEWEVDDSEEPVSFTRPEGAGALQVTAEAPRPLQPGQRLDVSLMLRAFLARDGVDLESLPARRRWSARELDWASCEYTQEASEEGPLFWRVWMVTNHDVVVFVTYACRAEDRDAERAAVDAILATLVLR